MSHFKKTAILILALFAALFLICGQASATTRTLTIGTASGSVGSNVSVPITLDNPSLIGGVAFTLTYDDSVLEFIGLEEAEVLSENPDENGDGQPDEDYTDIVGTNLFYQFNKDTAGRVYIAAASANEISSGNLFNATFKILGGSGTYPINISATIISNAEAGYMPPSTIPVLVGTTTPDNEGHYSSTNFTPYFAGKGVSLVAGGITVNANKYAISGKAYYGSTAGSFATGCTVTLMRSTNYGYVFDSSTTVNSSGDFSFSKPAGTYQVLVASNDPGYYSSQSASFNVTTANYTVADIVLPAPLRLFGSVTINGGYLPGLQVKVMNGSTIIGTYAVNADGSFQTPALPQGTYTLKAVYGSLETTITAGQSNLWTPTLRSIGGTISNLTGSATLMASSDTGKMKKTMTVSANGSYSITNLVPANDYIVSAAGATFPVTYYNGKYDYNDHDPVDITTANVTNVNFDCEGTGYLTKPISGTVTEGSTAVTGVRVYAFNTDTFALTHDTTDGSGGYSINVPLGTYEIFVIKTNSKVFYYKDGGTATQSEAEATKLTIENTGTYNNKNMNVAEGAYSLTGKVTYKRADGDPAAYVLVMATAANGKAWAITESNGTYTLSGLSAGDYEVQMNPLNRKYAIQSVTVTIPSVTVQNFVIDSGNTLSGKIIEEGTETAIQDALVYLRDQETGLLVNGKMYYSDNAGDYVIADIPSSANTLNVSHPEYASEKVPDLDITTDMTLDDIRMSKGAYFNVNVHDTGDNPLKGALVMVARTGEIPVYAMTDENGKCTIYGLNADYSDYTVMAQKRGYVRQTETAQTPATTGAAVDIELPTPAAFFSLSGTITDSCGGSAPAAGVRVLVSTKSTGFYASTVTDSSGNYSFTGLPQATDYSFIVVIGDDMWVDPTPLNLTGNTDKDVNIPCF